ncbi:MAG: TetR/AcrR family transcriptional regulator [Clostridium sp.]
MNQKEKSQLSREKILNAAIVEFGTKGYSNASINNICNDNKISKGLIYHNYKNKDEIFLSCVKHCFDELIKYLSKEELNNYEFEKGIKKYLDLRYEFFNENENLSHIFFNTILQPPVHLKDEIKSLRKDFDELNIKHYKYEISKIKLREGITEEDAMEFFWIFIEMFNGYFQSKSYGNNDFNSLIQDHELKLSKILNIMIYGLTREGSK